MSKRWMCVIVVLAAVLGSSAASGEGVAVTSKVEQVTLYRGQALVTRKVALPAGQGELEIIVGELPARIVGTSLSASAGGADGVTIRSVRYRTRAVAAAPKAEVAALDKQIKQIGRKIYSNKQMVALLGAKGKYLDNLQGFTAPTAKVEMSKGVLNPKTLVEVSNYILQQRTGLTAEGIRLEEARQDLNEELSLLQRKRRELTRGASKTVREAVVFLSKKQRGAGSIRLSYLTGSANWSPAYNVRTTADGKKVKIEYLAQVNQMSGEDWAGVKLTLSTATPAMNAQSPILVPMWVALTGVPKGKAGAFKSVSGYSQRQSSLGFQQHANIAVWNARPGDAVRANWALNRLAAQAQGLELNVDERVIRAGRQMLQAAAEGLAVSYPLDGSMSLPSRSDRQLVQIAAIELSGKMYYEAIPILSSYVYRAAEVTNTGALPLLSGPYSAYIGGEFVGRGSMPLTARGQTVILGLGVDAQLRCRRELVDKSDKIVWGSRVQDFRYQLRLENYKDRAVTVRLLDRIPASKSENVKITLGQLGEKLSKDPEYVRDQKDKGLLRWDIRLAGGAAKAKAHLVKYSFEMKFAKDAHVGREAAGLLKQMELDNIKMMRQMR